MLSSNSLVRVWRLLVPNDIIEQHFLFSFFKKYYLILFVLFMEFDSWSDQGLTSNYRFVLHDKTTLQVICCVVSFASQFVSTDCLVKPFVLPEVLTPNARPPTCTAIRLHAQCRKLFSLSTRALSVNNQLRVTSNLFITSFNVDDLIQTILCKGLDLT